MLFERRLREGIDDGSVTVAFRRWRRPQVVAGGRYRTGTAIVEVVTVDTVAADLISDDDARHAGYTTAREVLSDLRGEPSAPIYRLAFQRIDAPDPRNELAHDANLTPETVAEIDGRLDRYDRVSPRGPWTQTALRLISERPGVRAVDLAASIDWDKAPFKVNVRKLKNLGLTLSLRKGYELSPRGAAYLRLTRRTTS